MPASYITDDVVRCAVGYHVTCPGSSPCKNDLEGPFQDDRWPLIGSACFAGGATVLLWSAIIEGLGILFRLLSSS
jgi:hypothetical protein